MSKVIRIRIKAYILLLLCLTLLAAGVLYFTNGIPNLVFSTLTPGSVDTVVVHDQFTGRTATLTEEDIRELVVLLQKIRLHGQSVRLSIAESMNPQYTVHLRAGIKIDVACYSGYYIVNGRGYPADALQEANGRAINEIYLTQLSDRTYFPREEADAEG